MEPTGINYNSGLPEVEKACDELAALLNTAEHIVSHLQTFVINRQGSTKAARGRAFLEYVMPYYSGLSPADRTKFTELVSTIIWA